MMLKGLSGDIITSIRKFIDKVSSTSSGHEVLLILFLFVPRLFCIAFSVLGVDYIRGRNAMMPFFCPRAAKPLYGAFGRNMRHFWPATCVAAC